MLIVQGSYSQLDIDTHDSTTLHDRCTIPCNRAVVHTFLLGLPLAFARSRHQTVSDLRMLHLGLSKNACQLQMVLITPWCGWHEWLLDGSIQVAIAGHIGEPSFA